MAANVQAVPTAFKDNILFGIYNLNVGAHTLKAALYFVNQSLGTGTGAYSATGEVTGTNYTAGGIVVPNATAPLTSGTTAYWTPSNNLVWPTLTVSSPFDTVLIYDATAGNSSICVLTFPAQTITATTFTILMPTNASTSALLQVN